MKSLQAIAVMFALLIVSVPVCFAEEINLVTDANGNLVYDGEFYREYNSLNQLVRIYNGPDSSAPLLQEFEFDPIEERIVKKVTYYPNGNPRETVIYFSQDFVRVDYHNGTVKDTEYVYLEGQLVAQVDGETLFIHGNNEGSSSVVTDSNGNVVENTTYTPFGEILQGGDISRYDYTGQEYDSVTGDYDYNARKYNAAAGQFNQPDTIISSVFDPMDLNHYSYVHNNPYKFTDPNGRDLYVVNRPSSVPIPGVFDGTDNNQYGNLGHTYAYVDHPDGGYVLIDMADRRAANGEEHDLLVARVDSMNLGAEDRMLIYVNDPDSKEDLDAKMITFAESQIPTAEYNSLSYNCDRFTSSVAKEGGHKYISYTGIPNIDYYLNVYNSLFSVKENYIEKNSRSSRGGRSSHSVVDNSGNTAPNLQEGSIGGVKFVLYTIR